MTNNWNYLLHARDFCSNLKIKTPSKCLYYKALTMTGSTGLPDESGRSSRHVGTGVQTNSINQYIFLKRLV